MNIVIFIFCGLLTIAQSRNIERDAVSKPRVVNGENAKLGERPFQVSLQLYGTHDCGGSILNNYWVVTAAHCVDERLPSSLKIVAGTIDLKEPHSTHKVKLIIVHENYTPDDSSRNDIALIKVATPFKFSDRVQPVALPEPHINVKTNTPAVLSGWGLLLDWSQPKKLQKATIYIADPKYCSNAMKKRHMKIYPVHLCAYDPSIRRGQCSGDSGGPLTVDGKLAGIVSWSIKDPDCASTKFPGVYTRVSEFVEWIQKHIAQ